VNARSLAAWCIAAFATLALAACSTAEFAYRHAGLLYDNAATWILWSVDDYLDLTAEQKAFARQRLDRALEWHRRNVLPDYAAFLRDVERQVDAGLDAAAFRDDREKIRGFYRQVSEHLLPDAAELFALLDDAQVDDLASRLAKADGKMLEEARTVREHGVRRTLDHLEAWTGPLTAAQRDLVKSRMRAFPDLTAMRVAEWRQRQARLVALMRERPPRDRMVAALHALLFDEDAWRDPEYARALAGRDDQASAMLADLARTLSPEQVAHIRERIRGLLADIANATK
jgi:hypothetical protein